MFDGVTFVRQPPRYFWDRIRDGEVYSHARFGDGEWSSVLQVVPPNRRNCDGHRYFCAMGRQLEDVLRAPSHESFMLGMQSYGFKMFRSRILKWLTKNNLGTLRWYDADTLAMHRVSARGSMRSYFEALATKQVIMVGPPHLAELKRKRLVSFSSHVTVPRRDAYTTLDAIERRILKAYSFLKPPVVISISCGLPAGILIHRLFQKIGKEAFIFDAGSVYDVYCGVSSRKYMKDLQNQWRKGKKDAPHRIRAKMEKRAAGGNPALREVGG